MEDVEMWKQHTDHLKYMKFYVCYVASFLISIKRHSIADINTDTDASIKWIPSPPISEDK